MSRSHHHSHAPSHGRKVYIGNLNPDFPKDAIEKEFAKFGEMETCWLAKNPAGFGFVIYRTNREAENAIEQLNGVKMSGVRLVVELAKNQDSPSELPRSTTFYGKGGRERGPPPSRSGSSRYDSNSRFPPRRRDSPSRRYSPPPRNGSSRYNNGTRRSRSPAAFRRRSTPPLVERRYQRHSPPPAPVDRRSRSPLFRPKSPPLQALPSKRYDRRSSPPQSFGYQSHRSLSPREALDKSPRREKYTRERVRHY